MATLSTIPDESAPLAKPSAVPRDWEPFMSTLENPLERNHKGPVGKI